MPLNITNYNIDYKEDNETITEIENIIHIIKENITGKYYKPYKNFLKKLDKFVDMMVKNFESEYNEVKKQIDEEENFNNDDDDTISITSISDYEQDELDNEEKEKEEKIKIKQFEKILESKLKIIKNRFEFEFSKIYDMES